MEEIFPTIYSVPFFNEQCFLDYTTGVFGAHISQTRERAARLLSRTQAREFRQTGSTSERRAADGPLRIRHDYCLIRVWLSAASGRGGGHCGCDLDTVGITSAGPGAAAAGAAAPRAAAAELGPTAVIKWLNKDFEMGRPYNILVQYPSPNGRDGEFEEVEVDIKVAGIKAHEDPAPPPRSPTRCASSRSRSTSRPTHQPLGLYQCRDARSPFGR